MKEKVMSELLGRFPVELFEETLTLLQREQVLSSRGRIDLVFSDVIGRYVLVEVQEGTLDQQHLDRMLDYHAAYMEEYPDHRVRLIFVANNIAFERKQEILKSGFEYREIPTARFRQIAEKKGLHAGRDYVTEKATTPAHDDRQQMLEYMAKYDIKFQEYKIYSYLKEREGTPIHWRDFGIGRPTIKTALWRLQRIGLIKREPMKTEGGRWIRGYNYYRILK